MPSRHRSRQQALQILYQWDIRKQPVEDSIEAFYSSLSIEEGQSRSPRDAFAEELARGTTEKAAEIDLYISQHSQHWRLERMPVVDRNILRLAIFEMLHQMTPHPVVIDEALELARCFAGAESVAFINGVLDAVHREFAG